MPHIVAENISPWSRDNCPFIQTNEDGTVETKSRYKKYLWRNPLGELLEKVTAQFWGMEPDEVTCFFPHDPSVPTDPYPPATIRVMMDLQKIKCSHANQTKFAQTLGEAVESFLNCLRNSKTAEVKVLLIDCNTRWGFYRTPKKDESEPKPGKASKRQSKSKKEKDETLM
jgi:hypothetical protein